MPTTKPIHELKDQLSAVLAQVEASGEPVLVTRHGRVIAQITPAPPRGVVLGAGARAGVAGPTMEAFEWGESELDEMLGGDEPA